VAEFVRAMKTMESQQLETPRGVNLNTIHGVKGLEYAVVFIIGMEEGKLPIASHSSCIATPKRNAVCATSA
jgi:superfamily I DNA/RNA helicase